jgi:hypothetical protein
LIGEFSWRLARIKGYPIPNSSAKSRKIVTPEEAERYGQIFPPAQAENVVPIGPTS